jgi:hypothetical protein
MSSGTGKSPRDPAEIMAEDPEQQSDFLFTADLFCDRTTASSAYQQAQAFFVKAGAQVRLSGSAVLNGPPGNEFENFVSAVQG